MADQQPVARADGGGRGEDDALHRARSAGRRARSRPPGRSAPSSRSSGRRLRARDRPARRCRRSAPRGSPSPRRSAWRRRAVAPSSPRPCASGGRSVARLRPGQPARATRRSTERGLRYPEADRAAQSSRAGAPAQCDASSTPPASPAATLTGEIDVVVSLRWRRLSWGCTAPSTSTSSSIPRSWHTGGSAVSPDRRGQLSDVPTRRHPARAVRCRRTVGARRAG